MPRNGLEADVASPWGAMNGCPVPGATAWYRLPPLMKAIATLPAFPAPPSGWEDAPGRPVSTWTGGPQAWLISSEANTWLTAPTAFRETSAPVPSDAIATPPSDWMSGLGPSTLIGVRIRGVGGLGTG